MLLIVAVGSNYALFFDRNSEQPQRGSVPLTLASLLVANLATVIAFGVLASSSVPVLADLGSTVAPGTLLALLFAALMARRATPGARRRARGRCVPPPARAGRDPYDLRCSAGRSHRAATGGDVARRVQRIPMTSCARVSCAASRAASRRRPRVCRSRFAAGDRSQRTHARAAGVDSPGALAGVRRLARRHLARRLPRPVLRRAARGGACGPLRVRARISAVISSRARSRVPGASRAGTPRNLPATMTSGACGASSRACVRELSRFTSASGARIALRSVIDSWRPHWRRPTWTPSRAGMTGRPGAGCGKDSSIYAWRPTPGRLVTLPLARQARIGGEFSMSSPLRAPPPALRRSWRPSPLIRGSVALHVGAAVAVLVRPPAWPWALAAVVADHLLLTAAGLWPRSRWLGPNWTHLPADSRGRPHPRRRSRSRGHRARARPARCPRRERHILLHR